MRYFIVLLFVFMLSACGVPKVSSDSKPVSHQIWDELLQEYVDQYGLVNYEAWAKDTNRLQEYLNILSNNHPNDKNWSKAERYAYWVNAYNAFTVKLILDHYPIDGIKDIKSGIPFVNTVWDIKFINIEDQTYDLNNIEHGILRNRYIDDPRFHFAINCASMSCPKLQNYAYTAENLDAQLDEAAREFIREPYRNRITSDSVYLSKILNWYWGDFKDQYDNRVELVNNYLETPVPADTPTTFLDYDWSLNEQTPEKQQLLAADN